MALTDLMVRQARAIGKPYTLADFDGLSLFVSANAAKTWHFRYSWAGQRARISFGGYPELFLREARDFRDEARALLARGIGSGYGRQTRQSPRQRLRHPGWLWKDRRWLPQRSRNHHRHQLALCLLLNYPGFPD